MNSSTLFAGVLKDTCTPPEHAAACFAARTSKPCLIYILYIYIYDVYFILAGGDLIQIWAKKVSAAGLDLTVISFYRILIIYIFFPTFIYVIFKILF